MSLTQISSHQLHAFWKPNPLSCPSRVEILCCDGSVVLTKLAGREGTRWVNGEHVNFQPQANYRILQVAVAKIRVTECWCWPLEKTCLHGKQGLRPRLKAQWSFRARSFGVGLKRGAPYAPGMSDLYGTTGFQLTYVVLELFSVALPLQLWYISSHGVRNHPQHLWALAKNGCGRWLTGPVILVVFEDCGTFILSNYLLGEAARKLLH